MDQTEAKILELIQAHGGAIAPDFFIKKLREMADKELLQVVFPDYKKRQHYMFVLPRGRGGAK